MIQRPLQLSARDFDAYLPEKATSNAYSRPRLELKQRALVWGRRVALRLGALGITVELDASDEHPTLRNKKRVDCQWVYFWRDQVARDELDRVLDEGRSISDALGDPSTHTRHAFLGLRIDCANVEVCVAVHPDAKVDIDNLRARFRTVGSEVSNQASDVTSRAASQTPPLALEFTNALRMLPDEFAIRSSSDDRNPCGTATPEGVTAILERAAAGQVPLWIGWSVPRAVAIVHAEILDEQLEDAIVALAPIYALVAWSRDNDRIALDHRLAGIEQVRARTHAEAEAQNQRWHAERVLAQERLREEGRARRTSRPPPGGPTLSTLFKSPARLESRGLSASEPKRGASADDVRAQGEDRATLARALMGVPEAMGVGARVRVCAGPFAEKIGIVSELDGRGTARVLLGLLSTRVDVSDLEAVADGRDRPSLQSSHRRPGPQAPSGRETRGGPTISGRAPRKVR